MKGKRAPDILTPREWDVLALIREGLTNEQIAERLGISRDGVKYHVSEILSKLGLQDRIEAARWFARNRAGRQPAVAAIAALLPRRPASFAGSLKAFAALAGVAAMGGLVALVVGVILVRSEPPGLPPDRRTGDRVLDEHIARLLHDSSEKLSNRYSPLEAKIPIDPQPGGPSWEFLPAAEWTALLATADRQLYSVMRAWPNEGPNRDFNIILRVRASSVFAGWKFGVANGEIVDLQIGAEPTARTFALAEEPERYLVLPPADELPKAPAGHPLAVRSGDPAVDKLITLLEGRDADGLVAAVKYERLPCGEESQLPCLAGQAPGTDVDALAIRRCWMATERRGAADVERELRELASKQITLHAVANIPAGYQPPAEHILILVTQEARFRWSTVGLLERDGSIVGLILNCGSQPEQLYPPLSYVVRPQPFAAVGSSPRRSGVPVIDSVLDALQAGDITRLDTLIDYTRIGCLSSFQGLGSPPECMANEAPMTAIEVLPIGQCEGYYARRGEARKTLERLAATPWSLYAVVDMGSADPGTGSGRGRIQVVLSHEDEGLIRPGSFALTFSDKGITNIRYPCAIEHPEAMIPPGRSPSFLLPPP